MTEENKSVMLCNSAHVCKHEEKVLGPCRHKTPHVKGQVAFCDKPCNHGINQKGTCLPIPYVAIRDERPLP